MVDFCHAIINVFKDISCSPVCFGSIHCKTSVSVGYNCLTDIIIIINSHFCIHATKYSSDLVASIYFDNTKWLLKQLSSCIQYYIYHHYVRCISLKLFIWRHQKPKTVSLTIITRQIFSGKYR